MLKSNRNIHDARYDLTHNDFDTDSQFADISDDDYYTLTFPTHQPRNPETEMLDNDLSDSLSVTSDHQSDTYDGAILCSSDNDYNFHNAPDWAAEYCHEKIHSSDLDEDWKTYYKLKQKFFRKLRPGMSKSPIRIHKIPERSKHNPKIYIKNLKWKLSQSTA